MNAVAKPPVVPEAWVVIGLEGVHPAELHLPSILGVARYYAARSHVVFEGLISDFGVQPSLAYVGD